MDNYNKVSDIATSVWHNHILTTAEMNKFAEIEPSSEKMKNDLENLYNTYYGLNGDLRYLPDGILSPGKDGIAADFNDKVYTEELVNMDELYKLNTGLLNLMKRISEFKQEYKIKLK